MKLYYIIHFKLNFTPMFRKYQQRGTTTDYLLIFDYPTNYRYYRCNRAISHNVNCPNISKTSSKQFYNRSMTHLFYESQSMSHLILRTYMYMYSQNDLALMNIYFRVNSNISHFILRRYNFKKKILEKSPFYPVKMTWL